MIVQERAILRLVEAGISITQTGYSGQDATDDIVADAATKIAAVVEGTGKEDKVALHHLRNGTPTDAIALTVAELGVPPRGRPCRLGGLTRGASPAVTVPSARPGQGRGRGPLSCRY
ncbi:hypothetical protein Scani_44330 [Streptomyces caniferus]|uniref:Uncharacterized protein n=1 Tax=Streptomyces caniferus TaxID=285557 RepID=A0A640SF13_9ACTN|nr:hypothetical protein [Streptomyces caniferus]GFE08165.1 hypothetical protein Scani_44330 [Streptomyces caniferus]